MADRQVQEVHLFLNQKEGNTLKVLPHLFVCTTPPGGGYSPMHVYAHFQEYPPPPPGWSATLSLRLPDTLRGVTCARDVAHSG